MKRIIITSLVLASLIACNSNSDTKATTDKKVDAKATETSITDNPDYKAGLELVAKSDCFTCHKVDEAMTGPTYRDVANKYASEGPGIVPKLAEKVIKGGTGVWGTAIMLPHAGLAQADAEAMVKYVLLLKK